MKRTILFSALTCVSMYLFPQKADVVLPSAMDREQIIHHISFSLSYNSSYVLPSWVTYKITKTQINKNEKVKAKYIPDPEVISRSAKKNDYKDCGYIMAQLVNYLDVTQSDAAKEETYYLSNIVPMKLAFYNYIWLKSEELIRMWNANTQGLYVVCGPILTDTPFSTFGENKVCIPKRFYKAVYDPMNQKAIGFIFRNGNASGTLKSYAVSIKVIEKETGIDLFQSLDVKLKEKIESESNVNDWNFEVGE
jgi:endonuclease G, mitochondrial